MSERQSDIWYACDGPENDIVLSSRVRFARNLANFPFPRNFRGDDARRVQSLVFDGVAQSAHADDFQALSVSDLDGLGMKILCERGVLRPSVLRASGGGIIMWSDGRLSCTVNDGDHVKIISFAPGLAAGEAFDTCRTLDTALQTHLQFAASYDFGFLTSSLRDCGSGMHVAVRVHLPSLSFAKKIPALSQDLAKNGIDMGASFGAGSESGTALGGYYQLTTRYAQTGSELDQLAGIVSAVELVVKSERRERAQLKKTRRTELFDAVYRSYAKARFALLLDAREAVEVISGIKWGRDLGVVGDIGYGTLCALLYRIQEGHLLFVLKDGNVSFPKDIAQGQRLQTRRLRALILQEAIDGIKLG